MYLAMPRPVSTTRPAIILTLVPGRDLAGLLHEALEVVHVVDGLGLEELGAGLDLAGELVHLRLERVGLGGDHGAHEEVGGAVELVARPVVALVHLLAALDQVDRIEVEDALGLLVVAHHGMVAGEAEDVGDAQESRRQQVGLQTQAVAVAAGGLEDGVAAPAHDLAGDGQGAQAHDRALVVGDVETVDLVLEQVDVVQHASATLVPLGGPISPETTKLPLLQASR